MGTTAQKLTYLNTTKGLIKDSINALGGNLTNQSTFRSYAAALDSIYNVLPKTTETGTTLSLTPTLPGKLVLDLKGNTSQVQLSGKNIIASFRESTANRINYNLDTNGLTTTMVLSLISNTSVSDVAVNLRTITDAGVYTMGNISLVANTRVSFSFTLTTTQINTLKSTDSVLQLYKGSSGLSGVSVSEVQIENGTTATTYEQYCGGVPSPNPNYPQPVNVVSGDNSITIYGKNIFIPTLTNNGTDIQHSNCNVSLTNDEFSLTSTGTNIRLGEVVNSNNNYTDTAGVLYNVNGNSKVYVKCTNTDFNAIFITPYGSDKKSLGYTQLTSEEYTFPTNAVYFSVRFGINGSTTGTTYKTKVMVSFSPIIEYEAYQSQTYPINLPVKNLFDKNNANILNVNLSNINNISGVSNSNRVLYIPVKPNTTYVVSKAISNYFVIGTTETTPATNLAYYQRQNDATASSLTITTNSTAQYLIVWYWNSSDTLTEQQILDSIQIEESSKPNTYTPYGTTPIELCKIGDYQDYFYKDSDKWYLHKETGKVVIDGTNTNLSAWGVPTQTNTLAYRLTSVEGIINNTVASADILLLSNRYLNNSNSKQDYLYSHDEEGFATYVNNLYFRISKNISSTIEALKIWLSSNNLVVYYPLETPTNTEITYTPLINQLEAIRLNALSYNGTTNILQTNNDLPFIIEASCLKGA